MTRRNWRALVLAAALMPTAALMTTTAHAKPLVEVAFVHVGLDWQKHVVCDPRYQRPAEVDLLLADPAKARSELGWKPRVGFGDLVRMMVDADLERLETRPR